MEDLPIITKDEISIYQSDIDILCEDYISLLNDESMIYKSTCFHGLLECIYKRYLKNIIRKDNNRYDYEILNDIFYNIYIPICTRYNNIPTLIQFCLLCHIDYNTVKDYKDGYRLSDGSKVNNRLKEIVNGWSNISESNLLSKTINENGIGSMFALKAIYRYRDNEPIQLQIQQQETHQTREEIQQKYSSAFIPDPKELELSDSINDEIVE